MGCSHCYEVFAPELATFLPRMHPALTHVGKIPKLARTDVRQLETTLKEVEHLLASNLLPDDQPDALLDQWRELSLQIASTYSDESKP